MTATVLFFVAIALQVFGMVWFGYEMHANIDDKRPRYALALLGLGVVLMGVAMAWQLVNELLV